MVSSFIFCARVASLEGGAISGTACREKALAHGRGLPYEYVMESKAGYIQRLEAMLGSRYHCSVRYLDSIRVREVFRGQTTWHGTVELFELAGHPQATRVYAWSHLQGQCDSDQQCVSFLEVPPVDSPIAAVRAWLEADSRQPWPGDIKRP